MELENMYEGKVNSPTTFLVDEIDSKETEIKVTDSSVLPEAPNLVCIGTGELTETVKYESIEGNTLKECTRGFQGVAKNWDKLTPVARLFTEYDLGSLQRNVEGLNENKISKDDIPTELPANGINNSCGLDFYEDDEPIGRLAINSELDVMFPMGVSAFTPNENRSISLGTENLRWNQLYANSITGDFIDGRLVHKTGYLDIFSYSQANGEDANGHGYGRMRCYFSPRDKNFVMTASIGGDLDELSINYLRFGDANTTIWNGVASAIPLADNSIDLGNSNRRIRNIFVASGSISTSDKTEKKVLKPLDDKLIKDFILLLNPVEYEFKNGLRTHFGLIAQEVEEIVYKLGLNSLDFGGYCRSPILDDVETGEYEEVEEIDEDGETIIKKVPITKKEIVGERYGLRYEEFIAPLIKMVQMQQETIDRLEKRVKKLEVK